MIQISIDQTQEGSTIAISINGKALGTVLATPAMAQLVPPQDQKGHEPIAKLETFTATAMDDDALLTRQGLYLTTRAAEAIGLQPGHLVKMFRDLDNQDFWLVKVADGSDSVACQSYHIDEYELLVPDTGFAESTLLMSEKGLGLTLHLPPAQSGHNTGYRFTTKTVHGK